MTTIIGIDPGLVDTGVVSMKFLGSADVIVETTVFTKNQMDQLASWVKRRSPAHTFIEAYRSRANAYSSDDKMRELLADLRHLLPKAKVIDNTGMKAVVKRPLMDLLGVWSFTTSTHHQDLRSAARIALYGALKDEQLNTLLFDYVEARVP